MTLNQFENQQYMNIETFRKNGEGVRTPVWFVQDADTLLVWTGAASGKVKRIRRDDLVRVAPSDASGNTFGEWVKARACADDSVDAVQYAEKLMRKKYGFMFSVFSGLSKLRKAKSAILKVTLS